MQNTTSLTDLTETEGKFAQTLLTALQTQTKLDESKYKDLVTDDDSGYRVQYALTQLKKEAVGGYKVSLTSKQTQDMFDADAPLYGAEVKHQWLKSPTTVNMSDLMEPLVEVELVFTAKSDLSPEDSLEDLLNKTTVAPALELPDSRFENWFPALSKLMVMSDNAVAGRVVFGDEVDSTNFNVDDLSRVKAELKLNDKSLAAGESSEVLGNPLNSLQWLVKKLASQGLTLSAGQHVSSGTFVLPPHLEAGHYTCHFTSGLGDVDLQVK
ncbi:2-keto-4-pentenoate hydratase [Paucilactobacillus hokkaidonensis JCM 18461]|uniref:2-keto-4-pentenoate hydratase n=2 Tax=Paucilactobacillus hokkaidonensis TaxID=1193095 RepID=A0A0A1GZJ5_9LACO|nr:2-keto-4-pentenoate hydratase [Paucilactobacillus hokkaidonensis]KRO09910.1 fumarylacetoacetate (FAA) hydrolase [Paucilactobacillus hokkaidonensis]BAP85891.1 2-keto-4-pentenoate hydratase [Paucilactobacillus hokkaidonensis JCM 18461]